MIDHYEGDESTFDERDDRQLVDLVAPRVGGGYATKHQMGHYAYKYVDCTVRTEIRELKPARCERVEGFTAQGVRGVAVVQGGASLWSIEENGEVAIRNPLNGEIHHTVKRENENIAMTKITAQGPHVWVGTEDGGVEVYDFTIAVQISRIVLHKSAVHSFAYCDATGYMYSACGDMVVKWGGEAEAFEKLTTYTHADSGVTCLAHTRTSVFIGTHHGSITALDTHLNPLGTWSAHPDVAVSSMLCVGSYLFTAGSEGYLHTWRSDLSNGPVLLHTRESLHTGEAIRTMRYEPHSGQVWSMSDTAVKRWKPDMHTEPPFVTCEEGGEFASLSDFLDISMYSPWVAQRLWSLGSNGKNVSWFAAHGIARETMESAAADMKTITAQDSEEAQKWKDLITSVNQRDAALKHNLSEIAAENADTHLRQTYYNNWLKWLWTKKELRRQQAMSKLLARNSVFDLSKEYFALMRDAAKKKKEQRRKNNLSQHVASLNNKAFLRIYFDKLKKFQATVRRKKNREKLVDVLLVNTNLGLYSWGYRALEENRLRKKRKEKGQHTARRLLVANDKDLTHYYYGKWYRFCVGRREAKRKQRMGGLLQGGKNRELERKYFKKFVDGVKERKTAKARAECCVSMGAGLDRGLLQTYYDKLKLWRHINTSDRLEKGHKELEARHEQLLAEQLEQTFPDLRKQEQELTLKLQDMKRRKEEAEQKIVRMEGRKKALLERIARQKQLVKTIFEQFSDIMAKLKELSLNFEQDRDLIVKVTEKCRASDASKVFLEAHMEIKAVVVRVSGRSDLGKDDLWPLDYVIPRLQSHELRKLYIGVKIMVIAFDLLTKTDMSLLETDDEIVLNGGNLIELYNVSETARVKRSSTSRQ